MMRHVAEREVAEHDLARFAPPRASADQQPPGLVERGLVHRRERGATGVGGAVEPVEQRLLRRRREWPVGRRIDVELHGREDRPRPADALDDVAGEIAGGERLRMGAPAELGVGQPFQQLAGDRCFVVELVGEPLQGGHGG